MFFTYKRTFAIQLLALVDANYNFIYVDVGAQGRIGDAGVYQHSSLAKALHDNTIGIPDPCSLPNTSTIIPYSLVADEAFPLKTYIMKPYARRGLSDMEKIFNYRLSRARRVVENAFGILAHRFRVFLSPIVMNPSNVVYVVLASLTLHNFLKSRTTGNRGYCGEVSLDQEDTTTGNITRGDWRQSNAPRGMVSLPCTRGNVGLEAKSMRDELAQYFLNEGSIPWQWRHGQNTQC
jgi:DDE superfamily endonuclease